MKVVSLAPGSSAEHGLTPYQSPSWWGWRAEAFVTAPCWKEVYLIEWSSDKTPLNISPATFCAPSASVGHVVCGGGDSMLMEWKSGSPEWDTGVAFAGF